MFDDIFFAGAARDSKKAADLVTRKSLGGVSGDRRFFRALLQFILFLLPFSSTDHRADALFPALGEPRELFLLHLWNSNVRKVLQQTFEFFVIRRVVLVGDRVPEFDGASNEVHQTVRDAHGFE